MIIHDFDTEQFDKDCTRMMKAQGGTGVACDNVCCDECYLSPGSGVNCRRLPQSWIITKVLEWVAANPETPEIDWGKVPPDTRVLVWDNPEDTKRIRYFATFLPTVNQMFHCFNDGFKRVSASAIVRWQFCELAHEEDIERYRKK